jgi:hypothetical protein
MMQRLKMLLPVFILMISIAFVYAQDPGEETQNDNGSDMGTMTTQETQSGKTNVNIGPGMEAITRGATTILVPKDMIVTKEKGRITKEDIAAYLGRKFDEIESRFNKIELNQEELKQELQQLSQRVEVLEQRSLPKANATQGK